MLKMKKKTINLTTKQGRKIKVLKAKMDNLSKLITSERYEKVSISIEKEGLIAQFVYPDSEFRLVIPAI